MIRISTVPILFGAVVLAASCSSSLGVGTESSSQTSAQSTNSAAGAKPSDSPAGDSTQKSSTPEPTLEWKLYTSEEGKYQAEFPGVPTETTFPPPAGTNVEIKGVLLEVNTKLVFGISYFDLPAGIPFDMEVALAGTAKGAINGEITSFEDRTISGSPCKYGVTSGTYGGQDTDLKVLGCQASNRMYTVQIISAQGEALSDADADRFFNSIAFT